VELWERAGRGLTLNEAGSAFAPYAERRDRDARQGDVRRPAGGAVDARWMHDRRTSSTAAESFVRADAVVLTSATEIELRSVVGNRQDVLERPSCVTPPTSR